MPFLSDASLVLQYSRPNPPQLHISEAPAARQLDAIEPPFRGAPIPFNMDMRRFSTIIAVEEEPVRAGKVERDVADDDCRPPVTDAWLRRKG